MKVPMQVSHRIDILGNLIQLKVLENEPLIEPPIAIKPADEP